MNAKGRPQSPDSMTRCGDVHAGPAQDPVTVNGLCWDGVRQITERAKQGFGSPDAKASRSPASSKHALNSASARPADDVEASQSSEDSVQAWFEESSQQAAAANADALRFMQPLDLDDAGEDWDFICWCDHADHHTSECHDCEHQVAVRCMMSWHHKFQKL